MTILAELYALKAENEALRDRAAERVVYPAQIAKLIERTQKAESDNAAMRQTIESAHKVMHGDGVMDQGQAWDSCVSLLDAAIAKIGTEMREPTDSEKDAERYRLLRSEYATQILEAYFGDYATRPYPFNEKALDKAIDARLK